MNYAFAPYLPMMFGADPGGIIARSDSVQYHVTPLETPVQHSPVTNWNPGSPYPGPPAVQQVYIDYDSARWWGRMGQGQLVWSDHTEHTGEVASPIPQDMLQHIDVWQRFMGGFPSISRNRPSPFGEQVPSFDPFTG